MEPNRIPQKSLKLKQLIPILQSTNYRFVSLQYGDDGPHLRKFYKTTGIEVLHDDTIDPLRDMDGWLVKLGNGCQSVSLIQLFTVPVAWGFQHYAL